MICCKLRSSRCWIGRRRFDALNANGSMVALGEPHAIYSSRLYDSRALEFE